MLRSSALSTLLTVSFTLSLGLRCQLRFERNSEVLLTKLCSMTINSTMSCSVIMLFLWYSSLWCHRSWVRLPILGFLNFLGFLSLSFRVSIQLHCELFLWLISCFFMVLFMTMVVALGGPCILLWCYRSHMQGLRLIISALLCTLPASRAVLVRLTC